MAAAAALLVLAAGAVAAKRLAGDPDPGAPTGVPGRGAPQAERAAFALETVARGLVRPTGAVAAPGDADGVWVTEQTGRLVRVEGDARRTILDLGDRVSVAAERGLLGLAFHPDFARNQRFYVDYTDTGGHTRVVEYRVGDGPEDGRELLFVEQPEENHNGGALLFAPDGRLMVGMGDGGGAFDPEDTAQDPDARLGKLLAADVDAEGEIEWQTILTGLRNPWRVWMDPALNELWIGDVGQDSTEEIDRVAYEPDEPPKNLGWPAWEGDRVLDEDRLAGGAEPVPPVAVYGHEDGCSVTGGVIYRGREVAALRGRYVYGDFCSGTVWSLQPEPDLEVSGIRRERTRVPQLTSIGTDADGELLFTTGDGNLLRAVAP